MRINAAPRILVVAGACAAALIGFVISEGAARRSGLEVMLPMEAVDPRALQSGHYVDLNLTQRIEPDEACPPGEDERKWVALRAEGNAYRVAGGASSRESAQLITSLVVQGQFTCSPPTPTSDKEPGSPGVLRLDLGVSRYHVNQTDAQRIERVLREQRPAEATRAFAIVSVGRDGRARLKGLMIDGQRLELSWL
jgi:uncharacterized membrane-anchored protein